MVGWGRWYPSGCHADPIYRTPILWHTCGGGAARLAENPSSGPNPRALIKRYKAKSVELTGFEPVAPSLRKMRTKRSEQGKRLS